MILMQFRRHGRPQSRGNTEASSAVGFDFQLEKDITFIAGPPTQAGDQYRRDVAAS